MIDPYNTTIHAYNTFLWFEKLNTALPEDIEHTRILNSKEFLTE